MIHRLRLVQGRDEGLASRLRRDPDGRREVLILGAEHPQDRVLGSFIGQDSVVEVLPVEGGAPTRGQEQVLDLGAPVLLDLHDHVPGELGLRNVLGDLAVGPGQDDHVRRTVVGSRLVHLESDLVGRETRLLELHARTSHREDDENRSHGSNHPLHWHTSSRA